MNTTPLRCLLAATAVATGFLFSSCGDDAATNTSAPPTSATEAAVVAGQLQITGVGTHIAERRHRGAAYLQIANGGDTDDALVAAAVDPSVAAKVELHETTAAGGTDEGSGSMSSPTTGSGSMSTPTTDGSPMMRMSPVDRIDIPAAKTVSLAPGGYHIMMLDLATPLVVGTTVDLTLTFENAGQVHVSANVRDTAP